MAFPLFGTALPSALARLALVAALLCALSVDAAQRSPDAEALYQEALATAARAQESYAGTILNIDQPLWRQASQLAEQALALAPDDPEITLLLAEIYTRVGWYIRAWPHWQRYLELGGALDADGAALFGEAGDELGYARYTQGDPEGALGYYGAVAAALPDDEEALSWLARIHFEAGRPAEALPYWRRLTELAPDDAGYRYYLELTEQQLAVGAEASGYFQQGLASYEAGELDAALAQFEAAIGANDQFTQAYVWAGRTSLDLRQPDKAERYWRRVLELDPNDARAAYFATLAADQQRWGIDAANAFYEGQQHYEAGELEAAAERFDYAALLNPDYSDALSWAGRSYQELGDPVRAASYWQALLALEPDDARARYFLELAERQQRFGSEAGLAFTQGVAAFEAADLETAEARFRAATQANPDYAEAWAWLGRVAFTQARYSEAAEAYAKAAELEPENGDYRFFADEARTLSQPSP